ncbi:NAD(P)-binding domain-containing protein [Streptomyces sp. TE33382]
MGAPIARNLARSGFVVRVWNRTRGKAEALAGDGAYAAESPADAVEGAGAVLTVLRDGAAVREAIEAAGPAPGTVWIQVSPPRTSAMSSWAARWTTATSVRSRPRSSTETSPPASRWTTRARTRCWCWRRRSGPVSAWTRCGRARSRASEQGHGAEDMAAGYFAGFDT